MARFTPEQSEGIPDLLAREGPPAAPPLILAQLESGSTLQAVHRRPMLSRLPARSALAPAVLCGLMLTLVLALHLNEDTPQPAPAMIAIAPAQTATAATVPIAAATPLPALPATIVSLPPMVADTAPVASRLPRRAASKPAPSAPPRKASPAAADSDVTLLTAMVAHGHGQGERKASETAPPALQCQHPERLDQVDAMLCRAQLCAGQRERGLACR